MNKLVMFLLLAAVCAAAAAPASEEDKVSLVPRAAGAAGLETSPALRVRLSAASGGRAAGCTDPACHALCQALNWAGGFCLDEDWCLCYG